MQDGGTGGHLATWGDTFLIVKSTWTNAEPKDGGKLSLDYMVGPR